MEEKFTYEDIYDIKLMEENGLDAVETIKRIIEIDKASDNDAAISCGNAGWRLETDRKYRVCPECGKHSKKWIVNKYNTKNGERNGFFMLKCFDCTMSEILNAGSNDTDLC